MIHSRRSSSGLDAGEERGRDEGEEGEIPNGKRGSEERS
jgi:hypothetical protein